MHEPADDTRRDRGRRRRPPAPRIMLPLAAAGLSLAAAACGSSASTSQSSTSSSNTTAPAATTAPAPQSLGGGGAASLQQAFVSVIARVRPEVVQVTSTTAGTTDLGSGVVYDTKGDIVTNAHVVGQSDSFQVTFVNGQTAKASLVGRYTGGDLAVIKVSGASNLHPATFGDSKALQIGDITLAVGNPLGFSSSVTEGIVSFNGRPVQESQNVTLPSTVQTSAAINPGNSGGALVDLNGDVIGIPTLAATDQQQGGTAAGIGFAIPSDIVKKIVPQLISSGKVTNSGRAELGIMASNGLDASGNNNGVVVVNVVGGGPADKAGIKPGALITKINGMPTSTLADLQAALSNLMPGQVAQVTVSSQGGAGTHTVAVTLAQLPGQ